MSKYVEIRNTENNDHTMFEYETLNENNELKYLNSLDFNELWLMENERIDSIKKLTDNEKAFIVYDYIKETDKDFITDYKSDNAIDKMTLYDIIDLTDEYRLSGDLNDDKAFEYLAPKFNLKFGTVGYSTWSYYISLPDLKNDYISDLYNGYNFYDFYLFELDDNKELEQVDTMTGYVSRLDFKGFDDFITDYLINDEYKVINNNCLKYIVPKDKLIEVEYKTTMKLKEQQQ